MTNVLNTDKQIAVIGALAEGSSIRSIERITGVCRDTIMRLGVKVGKGCAALMDAKMQTDEPGDVKRVTVLHVPPVISPQTAVRAAIIREYRNNA